jgi:hypothetical protein
MRGMEPAMIRRRGGRAMALLALVTFVIVMVAVPPIAQDPRYHDFADHRMLVRGFPNTLNVVSNAAFLIVAIAGLIAAHRKSAGIAAITFFLGTLATFLGSTWYHLAPSDARLVYDRLGMIVCPPSWPCSWPSASTSTSSLGCWPSASPASSGGRSSDQGKSRR